MADRLLAVDVGNSRTKFGLFEVVDLSSRRLPPCLRSAVACGGGEIPWPDVRAWVEATDAVRGVVAGANPSGVQRVLDTWPAADWPAPLVVDRPFEQVLHVSLTAPEKVGVDRLLNAAAVNIVRDVDRPAVIVSTGTATTVDYVDARGAFAGGAILPGFELSARALHEYTALLPYIPMEELIDNGHEPLGLDTRHALRSGLYWGQLGAVRELVARLSAVAPRDPQLFLTGGGASLLAPELPNARWEPHLALQGLAVVASHASGSAAGTTPP